MPIDTHHYNNEEITVVWKPAVCIHSALCWKGLLQVFDPRSKPWIRMEGTSTERIIAQVKQCPSSALTYFVNNSINTDAGNKEVGENG